jgi:hypothetical protein
VTELYLFKPGASHLRRRSILFRQAGVAAFCFPVTLRPQLHLQSVTSQRVDCAARSRIAEATRRAIGTGTPFPTTRYFIARESIGKSKSRGKP